MKNEQKKPVIWIINNQHWPRALLRAELIERGFDAVGYINIAHALWAYRHPLIEKPNMIVLELRDLTLKRNELELLFQIGVPIIALGGTAEFNERLIGEFTWTAMMRRPFTIGAIADVVEECMQGRIRKNNEQQDTD
ncbi:MAG: hypothetical protein E3K32_01845 [wastewater metagenome]|nr:hypothetical protein [Candidatus Loosdrechtia aerotolerans]